VISARDRTRVEITSLHRLSGEVRGGVMTCDTFFFVLCREQNVVAAAAPNAA